MNDEIPVEDHDGLAALCKLVNRRSIKETILTCLLISTVQRSRTPRRRVVVSLTLALPALAVAAHYWHTLFGFLIR
jgi:hypothetical protein